MNSVRRKIKNLRIFLFLTISDSISRIREIFNKSSVLVIGDSHSRYAFGIKNSSNPIFLYRKQLTRFNGIFLVWCNLTLFKFCTNEFQIFLYNQLHQNIIRLIIMAGEIDVRYYLCRKEAMSVCDLVDAIRHRISVLVETRPNLEIVIVLPTPPSILMDDPGKTYGSFKARLKIYKELVSELRLIADIFTQVNIVDVSDILGDPFEYATDQVHLTTPSARAVGLHLSQL